MRYLAGIWEQRTETHLTPKEFGQLRDLRRNLGDFAPSVVRWMVDPAHWWRFCQHVRAESGLQTAPPQPHLGFLLRHRGRAVNVMRRELQTSTDAADVGFCQALDQRRYDQLKTLLLVLAAGKPDWLAEIAAAHTLADIQRVFISFMDATVDAGSTHS